PPARCRAPPTHCYVDTVAIIFAIELDRPGFRFEVSRRLRQQPIVRPQHTVQYEPSVPKLDRALARALVPIAIRPYAAPQVSLGHWLVGHGRQPEPLGDHSSRSPRPAQA